MNADFVKKIVYIDEMNSHLNGYLNIQIKRVWEIKNLHVVHEKAAYPQRVTDWWGFLTGGVVGSYFFENDAGNAMQQSMVNIIQ